MPKAWEGLYPNLHGDYIETSPATGTYNCAAFAVGDDQNWWDPLPPNTYFWPKGVVRNYSVEAYVAAFETRGFSRCQDSSLDPKLEKIAIYANQWGFFEHAARQLPDGRWTSKMAEDEDIIHDDLQSLTGEHAGTPVYFMSRERKRAASVAPSSHVPSDDDADLPATDANPTHLEDFTSLLRAAARRPEPKGRTIAQCDDRMLRR
jgi:hypothetical protein